VYADYPAAHSSDVGWFAVDAEGHVGIFDPGEDGPVPEAWRCDQGIRPAMAEEGREELWNRIQGADYPNQLVLAWLREQLGARPPSPLGYDVPYYLTGAPDTHPALLVRTGMTGLPCGPLVLLLDDLAALEGVEYRLLDQFPAGPPYVVEVPRCSADLADRLLIWGVCRWAMPPPREPLEQLGLFDYRYSWQGDAEWRNCWLPFARLGLWPATPVHVDELTPAARAVVSQVRFGRLSFRDKRLIQVCQWTPIRADYRPVTAYLDPAGCLRALPGVEDPPAPWPAGLHDLWADLFPAFRPGAGAFTGPVDLSPSAWAESLEADLAAFRVNHPGAVVRIALTWPDAMPATALYQRALWWEAGQTASALGDRLPPVLRGTAVIWHDGNWDHSAPGYDAWQNGGLYRWLGQLIAEGAWSAPTPILSLPEPLLPAEEWDILRHALADPQALRQLEQTTPATPPSSAIVQRGLWAAACALVQEHRAHGEWLHRRYVVGCPPYRDDFMPVSQRAVDLAELLQRWTPHLNQVSALAWQQLERLAGAYGLLVPIQELRLQALAVRARPGTMPPEELEGALLGIFQGQAFDLDFRQEIVLLERAAAVPQLPVMTLLAVAQAALFRALVAGDVTTADRCRALRNQVARRSPSAPA
jgi:hypothetical protein